MNPKPEEPKLNSLRREGATPTQTADACLNLQQSRPRRRLTLNV